MNIIVRKGKPPVDLRQLYGDSSDMMIWGEREFVLIRDRAAYMYATGCFPSHIHPKYTKVLRQISIPFRMPTSLDGCSGHTKVKQEVVDHLELEKHTLIKTVRQYVANVYQILSTYKIGRRRNFWGVYMFKFDLGDRILEQIIVQSDGAIKQGWR
jgi:hypothetical protein